MDHPGFAVLPCGGVPRMQKLKVPLVGVHGYQRFPLSKPVVGQNIALGAVHAYRASIYIYTYMVYAFPAHSSSFFSKSSKVECVLSSDSEFYLW